MKVLNNNKEHGIFIYFFPPRQTHFNHVLIMVTIKIIKKYVSFTVNS